MKIVYYNHILQKMEEGEVEAEGTTYYFTKYNNGLKAIIKDEVAIWIDEGTSNIPPIVIYIEANGPNIEFIDFSLTNVYTS